MDFRCISLFSGAQGLDLGMAQAGMDVVLAQDADPVCAKTIRANGGYCYEGDIRSISPSELLDAAGLNPGEAFMVCGGPPCQPFSTAGKRLGTNDPRGSLFADFVRMIDGIRPRFFVMENVKGLISSKLKDADGHDTATPVLEIILNAFQDMGYKTVYGILDAVNYGVPQFRERFILIGSRDNEDIFLPVPTHFARHQLESCRWRTLGNAIKNLEDADSEYEAFSAARARYMALIPEGGNWKDLPDSLKSEAMGGALNSGGGKVGFYRRLSYSQPSPTLTTSPGQKATLLGHPVRNRPLSVLEYARIQQFPGDWKFAGTMRDKYRQIGNAVPVGLGTAVGLAVMSTASGEAEIKCKRARGTLVHDRISQALAL